MTTSVTPSRHSTGAAVLDERRKASARTAAASPGGDVAGTDKVAMPPKIAVWTAKPASTGLPNALPAARTGRGSATLVHHSELDPGSFGLVAQGLHQVRAAPLAQPQIMYLAFVAPGNSPKIANQQGANLLLDGERHHLLEAS
jgi:hypothetical protein